MVHVGNVSGNGLAGERSPSPSPCRHHGGLQQIGRFEGCTEVYPHRDPGGHPHHLPHLYPPLTHLSCRAHVEWNVEMWEYKLTGSAQLVEYCVLVYSMYVCGLYMYISAVL